MLLQCVAIKKYLLNDVYILDIEMTSTNVENNAVDKNNQI